jgi:hypothetical protein
MGVGGGLGAHGGMGGPGGMSGVNGNFGGNSASHISDQGMTNTNGPNADTRTFGQDRATLRQNAEANDTEGDNDTDEATVHSKSSGHISAKGKANTNGINASTRLYGQDRANARHDLHTNTSTNIDASGKLMPNGGQSASHISDQGLANTNGPNAKTRLFGRDRAAARSNMQNTSTRTRHHSTTNPD